LHPVLQSKSRKSVVDWARSGVAANTINNMQHHQQAVVPSDVSAVRPRAAAWLFLLGQTLLHR